MASKLLRRIPSSLKLLLNNPTASARPTISQLPEDVMLETAKHLSRVDLLNLALCNAHFLSLFLPTLYASVDLRSSTQCQLTLNFLMKHPHIARCIKTLVVRPNYEEWAGADAQTGMRDIESWVAVTIDQLAPHLVNLRKFIWDGTEFVKYDRVWVSLRQSCPQLRHVGVTVGLGDFTFRSQKVMPTNSSLFLFNDLQGFTLKVKQLVGGGMHPPFDVFPDTFWDMLLNRCPNLRHLSIDTVNERYIDLRPLFQGRWPRLQHLTLGDFVLLDAFATESGTNHKNMTDFLAYHQNLESVVLHQLEGWYFPLSLNLPPAALPKLEHFSAHFLMVRHMPNVAQLQSLELTNHAHGVYLMSGALWAISQFPSLSSLRIWIDCHDSGDADVNNQHTQYFTDILTSAPKLLHLELSCSTDPTFRMTELSNALKSITHCLRSLVITQVKKTAREGDMLKDATTLFRENATLLRLQLQDAAARWRHPRDLRLQKVGIYEMMAPVISAQEIGYNRRGQRFSRSSRHVVRR